jgi:hypothetical protein
VDHGADIHAEDEEALYLAASNGHREVVKILLNGGAVVQDRMQQRALECGHFRTLYLLEAASDIPFHLIDFGIGLSVGTIISIGALVAFVVLL